MRKRSLFILGSALWLLVALCAPALSGVLQDTNVFAPDKLHRIRVSLSAEEWAVLFSSGNRGASGIRGEDYTAPDGRRVHIGSGFGLTFPWVHADLRLNDLADILTETQYGIAFPSAIEKGNVFGVQFHPEKSHDAGARLLKNFADM